MYGPATIHKVAPDRWPDSAPVGPATRPTLTLPEPLEKPLP
jgi:hypothetical protein